METLFRVLVGAFVCVAPTALFIGFWRGLQRMQNGELVERVADHQGATVDDLLPGTRSPRTDLDAERRLLAERSTEPWSEDSPSFDEFERP